MPYNSPLLVMKKTIFLAGVEHGMNKEEITRYRRRFGRLFQTAGFAVNDPTLGKDTKTMPRSVLLRQDELLQEQSDITIAYLPYFSNGTLREVKKAKCIGQLAFGFTDRENDIPKAYETYLDDWYTNIHELMDMLEMFRSPPGDYFTSAHTNGIRGDIFVFGQDTNCVAPHLVLKLLENSENKRNAFHFCCEKSHIHEFAQKLPTMLRIGRIANVFIVTKDGTPHDVQMHTIAEEVAENQGFDSVKHYVIEKGKLHEISKQSVRISRHLSMIEA